MEVILTNDEGHTQSIPLRTSDDTVSKDTWDFNAIRMGGVARVQVVLSSGRVLDADPVFEGQEPGRVGIAV